ncbi:uroporphyrinogen-III C-methyltransferase [Variovorax sp. PCZ-1]|uniref:uroporphyrinogen-III C-methyltransferase n=1 Tax=Variovorax sp. PCZ-1 TaxID=2835533 RepID=UPI001BCED11F|nr:uroporphyrinogen-III C-methyltransferase [Variovorax sp. PCZ-1]MBS7805977.1 uroporphyrinogen-III C-methyltransferase [Variovorax sp. PCZ-1]
MNEAAPDANHPAPPLASAATETASAPAQEKAAGSPPSLSRATLFFIALTAVSLALSGSLWLKLSSIQEALARQSADATAASVEGRTLAKSASEAVKEVASRQALQETKLTEVAMQRAQLEELMQSLSRSRDENLVVDLDSAIRLAQQQANLTGSLEPLLAALRTAEQRVNRSAQPRLAPLQRALAKDIDRVKSANVADTPSLLIKLDELVRLADEMPLANAVAVASKASPSTLPTRKVATDATNATQGTGLLRAAPDWLKSLVGAVREEARALVRVSRIDTPEAALLSPEQSFFARENLKLKLLNARLGLLSRQFESTRSDLAGATQLTTRYFDTSSRSVQQATGLLTQIQTQIKSAEQPRIDDSLSALATLSASTTQSK